MERCLAQIRDVDVLAVIHAIPPLDIIAGAYFSWKYFAEP